MVQDNDGGRELETVERKHKIRCQRSRGSSGGVSSEQIPGGLPSSGHIRVEYNGNEEKTVESLRRSQVNKKVEGKQIIPFTLG